MLPKHPSQKMDMYQCNYCTKAYAKHTTRMIEHLLTCRGAPQELKTIIQEKTKKNTTEQKRNVSHVEKRKRVNHSSDSSLNDDTADQSTAEIDKKDFTSAENVKWMSGTPIQIKSFMDKMPHKDQIQADEELLARAIYASGTPLAILENGEWLRLFTFLRPTFKVPSRHDVSNKLLDKTYDYIKEVGDKKITKSSAIIALQFDGFSNIRNEGIVNITASTPDPVLLKSIDTKTNAQNADYYAEIIGNTIDEIGPEKVMGLITDNASVCKKTWTIIEKKYADYDISCYGCAAHVLNLFVKDICAQPAADEILKDAIAISEQIKKSHLLLAQFVAIQKSALTENNTVTLKLPAKTRWKSSLFCLESVSIVRVCIAGEL